MADQFSYLVDPAGNTVEMTPEEAKGAVRDWGYAPATPEQASAFKKQDERIKKFGTTGQEIITGLEAGASAATFGLSELAERALGVPAEDIAARAEINPTAHAVGTGAGLVGSALVPGGPVGLVGKAGRAIEGAAARALPEATTALGRAAVSAGSKAIGGGAEGLVYGAGQVAHEAAIGDPDLNGESALAHIGLGGLFGAGIGGVLGLSEVALPRAIELGERAIGKVYSGLTGKFEEAYPKLLSVVGKDADLAAELLQNRQLVLDPAAGLKAARSVASGLDDLGRLVQEAERTGLDSEGQIALGRMRAALGEDGQVRGMFLGKDGRADADKIRAMFREAVELPKGETGPGVQLLQSYVDDAWQVIGGAGEYQELREPAMAAVGRIAQEGKGLAATEARKLGEQAVGGPSLAGIAGAEIVGEMASAAGHGLLGAAGSVAAPVMLSVKAAKFLGNPAKVVQALDAIEKAGKLAERAIDLGTGKLVRGIELAEGARGYAGAAIGVPALHAREPEEAEKGYLKRVEQVQRLASDPSAMLQHLDRSVSGVHEHAPQTSAAYQAASARAVQFLHSKIKAPVPRGPLASPLRPSAADIDRFDRYWDAVNDPLSVLKQARAGTLTAEGAEAVRTVYPALYRRIQTGLLDAYSRADPSDIPYQSKLMIGMLTGMDADGSLRALQLAPPAGGGDQQPAGPGASARPPKGSSAKSVTLGPRMLTDQQASGMRIPRKW